MRTVFILVSAMLCLAGCAGTPTQEQTMRSEAASLNVQLGIGYMKTGHYELALQKLNKALQFNDSSAEAHNAIAVLYEEIEEYGPAEHHFRQAVDLDPSYTVARTNYGRFLCNNGKVNEGEKQFLQIAQQNSGSRLAMEAYISAGLCARLANSPAQAESHFRAALAINPRLPRALYEMAELSHAEGQALQARAFLQRYHAVAKYNPRSLALGIAIEMALGNQEIKQEYMQLLLTQFADSDAARQLQSSP